MPTASPAATPSPAPPNDEAYRDMFFENYGVNPFIDTEDDHLSTFALDVDTGSYTLARRYVREGHLPPEDAVRVEEFVNYFEQGYAYPSERRGVRHPPRRRARALCRDRPLPHGARRHPGLRPCPPRTAQGRGADLCHRRLGLDGARTGWSWSSARWSCWSSSSAPATRWASWSTADMPTSSWSRPAARTRRPSCEAIDGLLSRRTRPTPRPGCAWATTWPTAPSSRRAVNRVILCSDGVANVGHTGAESILEVIGDRARDGITLTTVGFGMGNYNDVLMEQLADKGDGFYAYVDDLDEARRLFVENLTGTLQVIAIDAKVQVEFNPEVVARYRLLGFENRAVADEDFRDDSVDAGEIGAGHSVTALYEVKLHPSAEGRIATVYLRWEDPDSREVIEIQRGPWTSADLAESFPAADPYFQLAVVVAEYAEVLRDSYWAQGNTLARRARRGRAGGRAAARRPRRGRVRGAGAAGEPDWGR